MSERRQTLACLESCTGGLLASTLTDVPDSGYLLGAGVAYDAGVKGRFGVPLEVMSKFGVISPEVAEALALAAATWFKSDFGVGLTGVAGPTAQEGCPPGIAYVAIANRRTGRTDVEPLSATGSRRQMKAEFVELGITFIIEKLEDGSIGLPRGEGLAVS